MEYGHVYLDSGSLYQGYPVFDNNNKSRDSHNVNCDCHNVTVATVVIVVYNGVALMDL